jgi:hypothetical protein
MLLMMIRWEVSTQVVVHDDKFYYNGILNNISKGQFELLPQLDFASAVVIILNISIFCLIMTLD